MTKIELPGASEAGTTVEDLLDDKKYDWIAEKYNFYFCNFLTKIYENHIIETAPKRGFSNDYF